MAVTYLDIAGTYTGPGSYSYNVASYPGGGVFYVNSATGLDSRSRLRFMGQSSQSGVTPSGAQGPFTDPAYPLASIFGANGAIAYCQAGRGDVIIVAPGHTENVSTGAAITIPNDVTIIGGGYGARRPTITWTASAATFITFAGACQLQNLIFNLTGVATVVKGFLVTTSGVQFVMSKIVQASGTNQATAGVVLNAGADDFLFMNSEIDGSAATIANGIGISNPAANNINRCQIINSNIHGLFGTAPLSFLSTATSEVFMADTLLRQEHAATTFVLVIPAGTTFLITCSYNFWYSLAAAAVSLANFISGTTNTGFASIQNFACRGVTPETPAVAI
jgi:hypothetical protein